jgi:hypothetical protein
LDYCNAVDEPGRVTAVQILPAISGENAEPPNGPGWDWNALGAGCEALAASLASLAEVAADAPTEFTAVAAKTNDYVELLTEFSSSCTANAEQQSYDGIKASASLLDQAAQTVNELQLLIAE